MQNHKIIFDKWINFRLRPKYPPMPPSHEGQYLEHFFYDFYQQNKRDDIEYIPVFWTSYIDNPKHGFKVPSKKYLQQKLNSLDENKEYFTVIQSSNGIDFKLPANTKVFSCASKGVYWPIQAKEIIPIPLVGKPLINMEKEKDVLCSFVGSNTHTCREKLKACMSGKKDVVFKMGKWDFSFPREKVRYFNNIIHRSKFTLCPRGFGPTSYRLYEAMQAGSVPVYIYDDAWLPYEKDIPWNELCVMIHVDDVQNTYQIIKSKSDAEVNNYLLKIKKYYKQYFTFDGICSQILKML